MTCEILRHGLLPESGDDRPAGSGISERDRFRERSVLEPMMKVVYRRNNNKTNAYKPGQLYG